MTYHEATEEKTRIRRRRTEQAIALATQSRWEEAVEVNKIILELFPGDVDAYNRLGKALMELGRYSEAWEAYSAALSHDPGNTIAKRNLERLSAVKESPTVQGEASKKLDLNLFIEETGKTGSVQLHNLAPKEVLAKVAAGDQVYLRIEGKELLVENSHGETLGQIEAKTALRLIGLIEGGNEYVAAVTSVSPNGVRIIIKETFQHPSQEGKLSFPPKGIEGFRAYTKESLLRYDLEEEEDWGEEETEYEAEWEEEPHVAEEEGHYYDEDAGFPDKEDQL